MGTITARAISPSKSITMGADAPGFQRYESTNNKLDPSDRLAIDVTTKGGGVGGGERNMQLSLRVNS